MALIKFAPILLLVLTLFPTPASELTPDQPTPEKMAADAGVALPKLPWHVADVWWNFEHPTEHFESLSIDVTIDRDIPATYNLYVSPCGVAHMNNLQFYGGLQSNVNGWESKDSTKRVHPGKGAIFSRWSSDQKQPIGLEYVRMADGGLCESAGYEGSFCSVRRPFNWTRGTYTYSIVKGDLEMLNGKPSSWFHCLVRSHETGVETYVGSIRFEGKDFTFWDKHAAFVEVYSTEKIPHSGIPKVTVTFSYPRLNGEQPALKKASVNFNCSGNAEAPQCASARANGNAVVIEVGPIFKREKDQCSQPLNLK